MFGAVENMDNLLERSMGQQKVELASCENTLGTINIKRGIFHGSRSSPLLFVFALMPLSVDGVHNSES